MARGRGRGRGRGRPPKILEPPPPESLPAKEEPSKPTETAAVAKQGENSGTKKLDESRPVVTETLTGEEQSRKLWVDVISNNRKPGNGLTLDFVAPKVVNGGIVVEIEQSDIESEVRYWDCALIMYVLGGELSMNMVKQFMMKNWNTVQLPDLLYHDDGYFLLKFKTHKEKEEILMNGPYMIKNMPMILRDWKPNFSMKTDMLRTIPLWVKLPQLPLEYWGVNSLTKIGSAIGRPVVTDECTAHKLRVSYARILVEIDATQEVPREIMIKNTEGELVKQVIEYDWLPKFCGRCQKFGHNCATRRAMTQWIPKEKFVEQTKTPEDIPKVQSDTNGSTQKTPGNNLKSREDEEGWTSPKGGTRGRKTQSNNGTKVTPSFTSSNGFDVLGDLVEPPMQADPGPC
ncbi:uncharacterized protein LOC131636806 [Vicia villosa]|uniref:uncharacterized protein LOC131636806 n=1 Tax=Vicia villosa TaxID=3911 RepID=UPI00273C24BB|nr:uncharacterized protein LOC131636806 [Vicia villosa]